ncbi:MAG: putative membrane protein [Myxococcota bacterium]|jgi:uncharacterized membrane protein
MNKKTFISSVILGVASIAVATTPALAKSSKMEKCYGVVKAAQNDCSSKDGAHSCAGSAKTDGDKNEWIYLPKGACKRIVGGIVS